jgi:large subunit ribosomal protein L18
MQTVPNKKAQVQKRHFRLRKKLAGTAERPRMAVYRSNKHISVQLIDDLARVTLVSASTTEKAVLAEVKSGANVAAAKAVGAAFAKRAKEKGILTVVFDRGGNLYHGRIAALADAAREEGLVF